MLGRLELALGNLEAAAGYLRELPGRLLAGGVNDPTPPSGQTRSRRWSRCGELEQARAYLDHYEANADDSGARGLWPPPRAAAACCSPQRAMSHAALRGVREVSRRLDEHPFPLERGRTLLCLGTVRRQAQQKKAAREALEQALAIFEELGARLWAEKARAELRRISGRRPASDGADRDRAASRRARRARPHEQGDRRRALHGREHGRVAPLPCLPQARRPPRRARGAACRPKERREAEGRGRPSLGFSGFRACAPKPYPRPHGLRRRAIPPRPRPLRAPARSLQLEQGERGPERRRREVRYLGSTIVSGDEACFCEFDGPSAAAVAEVNRRAGLPFDRIVPAVTVNPKGEER